MIITASVRKGICTLVFVGDTRRKRKERGELRCSVPILTHCSQVTTRAERYSIYLDID